MGKFKGLISKVHQQGLNLSLTSSHQALVHANIAALNPWQLPLLHKIGWFKSLGLAYLFWTTGSKEGTDNSC